MPQWLDEDEQRAWRLFHRMRTRLASHLNRQLQVDQGLSLADYEVLVHLSEAPGERLRPFELQQRLHWEQSRLSHHLSRMQRRGFVERQNCPEDGRGAFVKMTGVGRDTITAAAPGHVDAVRRAFFDGLSRDQVDQLTELSEQVLRRLEGDARE
jgi:DNA-binding MarR family transcriptional regulator